MSTPSPITHAELAARYPQTVASFAEMGALDHLERLAMLDAGWQRILGGSYDAGVHSVGPLAAAPLDYELVYAGGGLGLIHATVMARRHGRRVLVFDRGAVGCAHREWNISREEAQALVALDLLTPAELESLVMREYRDGIVRFYSRPGAADPGALHLPEVLNLAIDAGGLLRLLRQKLTAAGGTIREGRIFRHVRADPARGQVEVELEDLAGGRERYRARLLLDGMGSVSPLALRRHAGRPFAGVCPTVGTVASGFAAGHAPDEVDLSVGEILVTVADAQDGEQLLWEGFPGRGDELTVYLFYYATVAERAGRPASLLALFEHYFRLLPSYKRRGPGFRHLRPVYGFIPARHSLRAQDAPLLAGVLPVGDAAAQQSPITFCGFGSFVRNLRRTSELLDVALRRDLLAPADLGLVSAFQINVAAHWVFSRFMHPWGEDDGVNRLQNLFLASLRDQGPARATRFFRDQTRWSDYYPLFFGLLRRYPAILLVALRVIGPGGVLRWCAEYAIFSLHALGAALARAGGRRGERLAVALADRLGPRRGLRLRAAYAAWRAMGWVPPSP